ncbi:sugar transferase [Streptomyces lasiicapitis]|uniref:sugar transferase n=1 Tax=Streptomyces lasiicapitis TaxID=1923961 RepID=UPI00332F3ADA
MAGGRVGLRGRPPARRRHLVLALVAVDTLAAVTAALLLPGPHRSPVLTALLLVAVLALNVQGRLYEDTLAPYLLDELPAFCGRIALAWCVAAVLLPALAPAAAPPLTPLLTAAALHGVLGAGGRALVHWHRRAVVRRRPRPVLVLGHGGQARSVAAALLRRPRCGLRPVGVVGEPADEYAYEWGGGGGAERRVGAQAEEWAGVGAEEWAGAGAERLAGAGAEHLAAIATEHRTSTATEHRTTTATERRTNPETDQWASDAEPWAQAEAEQRTGAQPEQRTGVDTKPRPSAESDPHPSGPGPAHSPGTGTGTGVSPSPAPDLPLLTTQDELHRAVIQNDVRTVLLLAGRDVAHDDRLAVLRGSGCELWELDPGGSAGVPVGRGRRPVYVAGFRCQALVGAHQERRTSAGKRALDIAVSGALLLPAGPVLLVCALVLRATEGPGVVFRQERVGKDGHPFTVLKFRTHRPADSQESATRWSVADEQRISPFCRFLRSTSLDELPQLWNVLRGDMSLVGPRPERPFFVERFSRHYPHYAQRHRVPTGITGLAQIHGLRGDTSIEDRCRFDNAYIDSWSLWQDVCILLRTVGCLLRRTGS